MIKKQMKILKVPKSKVENFVDGGDNGIDKGHYKSFNRYLILGSAATNPCLCCIMKHEVSFSSILKLD